LKLRNVASLLVGAAAPALVVGGCAGLQNSDRRPIPVAVILNTVKCEIAGYFQDEKARDSPRIRFLEAQKPFVVTLQLKTVNSDQFGVNTKIGPTVLPFGSASAGIGFSQTTTETSDTTNTILINPYATDLSVCDAATASTGAGIMAPGLGIRAYLKEFGDQLEVTTAGHPMMIYDKISYTRSFGILKKINGDGSIGFTAVPVTVNLSGETSREDVQTIKFTAVTRKPASVSSAE
jgi:hypothetical protein